MKPDAQLVSESLAGDLDAFGLLVQRYEKLVRATVLHICHDKHVAEDIAQETFLAAFQSLAKLNQLERFGAWLLSIARHKAAHHVRSDRSRKQVVLNPEMLGSVDNHRLNQEWEDLLELVERLPDHERVVIGLKHFVGHSAKEIAAITGKPVGTITKQLSRAYEKLKLWSTKEVYR